MNEIWVSVLVMLVCSVCWLASVFGAKKIKGDDLRGWFITLVGFAFGAPIAVGWFFCFVWFLVVAFDALWLGVDLVGGNV